ncbi:MAG TPA: tail fiber protein [Candidatus Angelobacter sp.]
MSDPFVAEIRMFAGNFAPKGWASCDGQLLPISQNTALFSLLGTFYGGDGKSTFGLPNLEGSTPVGQGQGAGLSEYFLGQAGGSSTVTLLTSEMPIHNHFVTAYTDDLSDVPGPSPSVVLGRAQGLNPYRPQSDTTMEFNAVSVTGSSFPHNNMMPFLTVYFIIAQQGVFPPRS